MVRRLKDYECPNCGWKYNISSTKIREGREVYCPNCFSAPDNKKVIRQYVIQELKKMGRLSKIEKVTTQSSR
jgi:predicted Zn finger-like uncharacterized protein